MAVPTAIAYSPKTQTDGVTLIGADVIVIDDTVNEGINSFPVASVDAPGEATLCVVEHFNSEDPADYETIRYTERHVGSNELRGVTRGVEGAAREWPDGSWIASFTSAAAWNEMRGEVKGFKNAIINGNFRINQRGHTSGGSLNAGDYGHDRWKALTASTDYTFSTTEGKTTITIPTAKEVAQIIEGGNLQSGGYTLSWEGSAQAKIGAGSYADSPITASITGGVNLTITFGAGTVANVQFEKGGVATSFEQRPIGMELSLCQRYYWKRAEADLRVFGLCISASYVQAQREYYPVTMRTSNPTPTIPTPGKLLLSGTPGTRHTTLQNDKSFAPVFNWTSGVTGEVGCLMYSCAFDAEL